MSKIGMQMIMQLVAAASRRAAASTYVKSESGTAARVDEDKREAFANLLVEPTATPDRIKNWIRDNPSHLSSTLVDRTALQIAVSGSNLEHARTLLELGADANFGDTFVVRPLRLAMGRQDMPMFNLLLDHKANPVKFYATLDGGIDELATFWTAATTAEYYTAFRIMTKRAEGTAQAATHGNLVHPMTGRTVLHEVALGGLVAQMGMLLEAKADPNRLSADWLTPLHVVAETDDANMAVLLLQHGADVNITGGSEKRWPWAMHIGKRLDVKREPDETMMRLLTPPGSAAAAAYAVYRDTQAKAKTARALAKAAMRSCMADASRSSEETSASTSSSSSDSGCGDSSCSADWHTLNHARGSARPGDRRRREGGGDGGRKKDAKKEEEEEEEGDKRRKVAATAAGRDTSP